MTNRAGAFAGARLRIAIGPRADAEPPRAALVAGFAPTAASPARQRPAFDLVEWSMRGQRPSLRLAGIDIGEPRLGAAAGGATAKSSNPFLFLLGGLATAGVVLLATSGGGDDREPDVGDRGCAYAPEFPPPC